MKQAGYIVAWTCWSVVMALGCGPARQAQVEVQPGADMGPTPGVFRDWTGPSVEVCYLSLADVLHLVEKASLWRRGIPLIYQHAFDQFYGLDEQDRRALKKYALVRSELEERSAKQRQQATFAAPFGPLGLFPSSSASLVDRFWQRVMAAGEPAAVGRALAGVLEPADAELVAKALTRLAPRVAKLGLGSKKGAREVERLGELLGTDKLGGLLESLGRFVGLDAKKLAFRVHPVWAPERADFEAVAYGDRILVVLPDKKPVGVEQAALVLHEMARRMLARMPAEKKAMWTQRFVEKAGRRSGRFALVEGLLDALSHGLAAPLLARTAAEIPTWPGDAGRKRFAEALCPLLREYLNGQRRLDMALVNRAAVLQLNLNPPKPADFVQGAMVVGEDRTIQPFKSQVVRWTVWRFPPSKNYNYPRKFAHNPGRTALLLFTPSELKTLRARFQGMHKLLGAMRTASGYTQRKQSVFIALERPTRGYLFVLAASSAQGMKKLAKTFFSLKQIPTQPVIVE